MKKIIGLTGICASVMMFALVVFANSIEPASQAQAQGCTDESKAAWYKEFTDFRPTDPAKAYEAAKKYLACSPQDDQYTAYLKKWSAAYDKEARKLRLQPLLYNDKKFAEAYALGKEILADEPENLRVLIDLGYGGYLAAATAKNESFKADALTYAKKAIQLIEAGKAPESWAPGFKSKDDALAYLYYTIGYLNRTNPSEALAPFIKAAQFESELKKDPTIYYLIAVSYEGGPYAKLSADYKAKHEGKDETPESKLALENINQVIDRMIDAYARAVALADPKKHEAARKEWMESLTNWYKYRHNQSDAGLNEMLASITSKPLPPEPTPLTSLPAAAPGAGQTSVGGASSGSPQSAGTVNTPATGSQSAAKPSGPAKTSSTTSPAKPRNRRR